MTLSLTELERDKYAEVWRDIPEYHATKPGLDSVARFMAIVQPRQSETLLDIGCGTGEAGLEFQRLGLPTWWLDITDAGLHPDVPRDRFIETALWKHWHEPMPVRWGYGYCCDVMEHVPPEFVMLCIENILSSCRTTWFQIALAPDNCGALIGRQLHLTVRPFIWWLARFKDLGAEVIDARDLNNTGFYLVRR